MKRRDVLLGIGAVTISQAPMAQLAEAVASNPTQCEFDSRLGYQFCEEKCNFAINALNDIMRNLQVLAASDDSEIVQWARYEMLEVTKMLQQYQDMKIADLASRIHG